jgi:predicted porin
LNGGTQAVSSGLAGSRIGFKGVEDLGGGLKSIAVFEYGLDIETNQGTAFATPTAGGTTSTTAVTTANTMVARQQMLALAGDFGTVATGYLQTTGYDFGIKYNVVGGTLLSPLGNIVKASGFLIGDQGVANRAQRAVAYISPDLGGLTVAVNYVTAFALPTNTGTAVAYNQGNVGDLNLKNSATSGQQITASLISANYTAGPLAVGVVYAGTNADAYTINTTEYAVAGSYDAGVAKITATYQTSKKGNAVVGNAGTTTVNAAASDTLYSVGTTVPLEGVGTLALSYAASNIGTVSGVAGAPGKNAKGYTVALIHPLSKTTTAYLGYSAMTQDAGISKATVANNLVETVDASGTAKGGGSSLLAIGLQKKF